MNQEKNNNQINEELGNISKPLLTVVTWINIHDRLPKKEDYYRVKFTDGSEDEKPFRNRPNRNILGFMTENIVAHWAEL
jgi:hypothetical protein